VHGREKRREAKKKFFFFFDMSTQEGREGLELVTCTSLGKVSAD
jgi:hypothetical protein